MKRALVLPAVVSVLAAGCCNNGAAIPRTADSAATMPAVNDDGHKENDPRLSADEMKAVEAAKGAILKLWKLLDAGELRYNVLHERDGWSVIVWRVERGKVTPAGAFIAVNLDAAFHVRRIVGGA